MLNWILAISLGCIGLACSGETSSPATAAIEPDPEAATLDVSCDLQGVSPSASCEPPQGTSSADTNVPFDSSASASGRVVRFHVPDMTCEGCAWQIREVLLGVPGVSRAHTRLGVREALVDYDPALVDVATIAAALEAAAYPSVEMEHGGDGSRGEAGG